jgi:hypothetical protein
MTAGMVAHWAGHIWLSLRRNLHSPPPRHRLLHVAFRPLAYLVTTPTPPGSERQPCFEMLRWVERHRPRTALLLEVPDPSVVRAATAALEDPMWRGAVQARESS